MKYIIRLIAIVAFFSCFLARGNVGADDFMVPKAVWIQTLTIINQAAAETKVKYDKPMERLLYLSLIQTAAIMDDDLMKYSGKAQATRFTLANLLREYALNLLAVSSKEEKTIALKIAAKNVKDRKVFTALFGDDLFLASWGTLREACEELKLPAPDATLL